VKSSVHVHGWFGSQWQQDVFGNMLDEVVAEVHRNAGYAHLTWQHSLDHNMPCTNFLNNALFKYMHASHR